jgi:hypothetical protein
MRGVTVKPRTGPARIAPRGRAAPTEKPRLREDGCAATGQSAIIVALLVGFLVIPLGLGLFEWRMQEVTYAALQTAAREAARDGAGMFVTDTLAASTPQLDPQQVAAAVQQSIATNLRATLPEVTAAEAATAAHEASTQGLTITGLNVCVTVVAPVHFITRPERTWTYSARACAHTVVPGDGP